MRHLKNKNYWGLSMVLVSVATLAQTISLKSPDGKNEIQLLTEPTLSYAISRNGQVRVSPTPIALEVEGKSVLGGAGLRVLSTETHSHNETIPTPIYKRAAIRDDGQETAVTFEGGFKVRLHARNDGVAYRFETTLPGAIRIKNEEAGFILPDSQMQVYAGVCAKGWRNDDLQVSWESVYTKTNAAALKVDRTIYLPFLATYADGGVMEVAESDVRDYPGWNIRRMGEGPTFVAHMAKAPAKVINEDHRLGITERPTRHIRVIERKDVLAETDGNRTYPWRVFMLADRPVDLIAADIVWALATPCRLKGDLSWIKPGKVAWDWWNNWNISGVPQNFRAVDFVAGCNTKTYEYYIDFAAHKGVEYVIFDEGWSEKLNIDKFHPDVDVPHLVKYANKRGVGIVLWCAWPQLAGRQREVCARFAKMGVKGFKIDFIDRDDQDVAKYVESTALIAAEYKLFVDYHGMHKPAGLSRTYPNILNYEGVHGLETAKWESDKNCDLPANDLKVFFTRMTAGPMDYTPGAMLNFTKGTYVASLKQPGAQGTRVRQMALMTLFEAPFQMLCDSPTQYLKNEECFDFMAKVPVVWDETVPLLGNVDYHAAVARRKGDAWWVGAMASWAGDELSLDTSFLKEGKWRVEIFADGINASRDATDYTHTFKVIRAGEKCTMRLAPGGGWTAHFTPANWWNF